MDKPIVLYRVICECIDEHIFDVTTNDFETIVYHDKRSQPRLFTLSSLLTILNSNHETIIYHTIMNQYQLWKIKKRLIAYRLFLLKHIFIYYDCMFLIDFGPFTKGYQCHIYIDSPTHGDFSMHVDCDANGHGGQLFVPVWTFVPHDFK